MIFYLAIQHVAIIANKRWTFILSIFLEIWTPRLCYHFSIDNATSQSLSLFIRNMATHQFSHDEWTPFAVIQLFPSTMLILLKSYNLQLGRLSSLHFHCLNKFGLIGKSDMPMKFGNCAICSIQVSNFHKLEGCLLLRVSTLHVPHYEVFPLKCTCDVSFNLNSHRWGSKTVQSKLKTSYFIIKT